MSFVGGGLFHFSYSICTSIIIGKCTVMHPFGIPRQISRNHMICAPTQRTKCLFSSSSSSVDSFGRLSNGAMVVVPLGVTYLLFLTSCTRTCAITFDTFSYAPPQRWTGNRDMLHALHVPLSHSSTLAHFLVEFKLKTTSNTL